MAWMVACVLFLVTEGWSAHAFTASRMRVSSRSSQWAESEAHTVGSPPFPPKFPLLDLQARMLSSEKLMTVTPVQLAYIGDSVYELHARTLFLWPLQPVRKHRDRAVELVRAETQSTLLRRLMGSESFPLTVTERNVLRRGRNASGTGPPRLPGGAYGEASALETLLGHLYLSDRPRLQNLLDAMLQLSGLESSEYDGSPVDWSRCSLDELHAPSTR